MVIVTLHQIVNSSSIEKLHPYLKILGNELGMKFRHVQMISNLLTYHNPELHILLAFSHAGHSERSKVRMQEFSLIFPQPSITIDNTCAKISKS